MTPAELLTARYALAMTQQQLGEALGYSGVGAGRSVRKWERGEAKMPGRTVTALRLLMAAKGVR